jgi:SAM-dependent methyltransferase
MKFLIPNKIYNIFQLVNYTFHIQKNKPPISSIFLSKFKKELEVVQKNCRDFVVIEEFRDDSHGHPKHYIDFECEFASEQIAKYCPKTILDIGSYRRWLIGVMASCKVTTLDVRNRESFLTNESVITDEAYNINLPSNSFDMIISLNSIEHFGLGRYGDLFDLSADIKAIDKMIHLIRTGGHLIFSVPVTSGPPCIAFNSHRIYSLEMVKNWCKGIICDSELFIKAKPARICQESELTSTIGKFDFYCGCYKKL